MKKTYLFFVLAFLLLVQVGYGNVAVDAETKLSMQPSMGIDGKSMLSRWVATEVGLSPIANTGDENPYTVPKMKSGKIAYGFCIYDDAWGTNNQFGLYSFNTANPSNVTREWITNLSVDAAVYYDGYYYAQTSKYSGVYTSMEFGKFNATTGEYTIIADFMDILPQFTDFTIDYSTDPPSLLGLRTYSVGEWKLVNINMSTGEITDMTPNSTIGSFFTLACGFDGTVYSVGAYGTLYTINKSTGEPTEVGETGMSPKFLQSMEFDHTDGILYWALTDSDFNGKFGMIDPTTGAFTDLGKLGNNAELTGLHIPFVPSPNGSPAKVSNIKAVPAENGVKTATISWNNPLLDNAGANLSSITAVKLYRNNELIKTYDSPSVGGEYVYVDNPKRNGNFIYKITVENSIGVGNAAFVKVFVGEDIPMAPKDVVLSRNGTSGILSWIAPKVGLNGGWINGSALTYKITRKPDNKIVAEAVQGNSYTDIVGNAGSYTYNIQSSISGIAGGSVNSNPLYIGNSLSLPYQCLTDQQWSLWTVINVNEDNRTWVHYDNGDGVIVHYTYSIEEDADDWLISPPITLNPGSYKLSFDYKSRSSVFSEKMGLYYGRGETVATQSNLLADYNDIMDVNYKRGIQVVTVAEAGDYNFSFYAYSEAGKAGIQLNNVKLEAMVENDLEAIGISGNMIPVANVEQTYTVKIRNGGSLTQNSYEVELIDEANAVLSTVNIDQVIGVNETKEVTLTWTPTAVAKNKLRGKVVLLNDQTSTNNISPVIEIEVQPEGLEMITIGDGNIKSNIMPLDFYYGTSTSQTIYLKDEIGLSGGIIKKIVYPYSNVGTGAFTTTQPIKVYMTNTELRSTGEAWIPKDEFKKVYEGTVQVVVGEGNMIITLDTPFLYSGENICVMTTKSFEREITSNIKFYLTETSEKRTVKYVNNSVEFDWTQEGRSYTQIPSVILQVDASGAGKITGIVKCNGTTVDNVKVVTNPLGMTTTTDVNGVYSFGYVTPGVYSIKTYKHGYVDNTIMGITVDEFMTSTVNITINELAQYSVSGSVTDVDGNTVSDAIVIIKGYDDHNTTTDENGEFRVDNVYKANEYSIKVIKIGLTTHNGTFDVVNGNVALTIVLGDIVKAPTNVVANVIDSRVNITWDAPVPTTTFRYDNGTIAGQMGFTEGTAVGVMGSVHRKAALLESMSWFTSGPASEYKNVNAFVIDLDEFGRPSSTALFSQMDIPNTNDEWTSFTFPTPVYCPNGFMIAISATGSVGIGRDSGKSKEWPFVPNTGYYSSDYTSGVYNIVSGSNPFNFLIRAEGFELESTDKALAKSEVKSIKGYNVWRLLEGEEEYESRWTLLTPDKITSTNYTYSDWGTIASGAYKFAVKTVYTNNTMSTPSFSKMVPKDIYIDITVSVTTNIADNNSASGAIVKLTNNDNKAEHIYTGTIDEAGGVIITNVRKGTYRINIYLHGYEDLEIRDVILQTADTSLNYELQELIITPFNLRITKNDIQTERLFSWDISNATNMTDDFENHPDFEINSSGDLGWSYIDGDQCSTYGLENALFPSSTLPMAYVVFNPSQTVPVALTPDVEPAIQPHSGSKFLASFAAMECTNQDYIISPRLAYMKDFTLSFWAKTFIAEYGFERMRVGYSTTGSAQEDFTHWVTEGKFVEVPDQWTQYSYTIPYTARYITIECVSEDAFIFMIDDISIQSEEKSLTKYEVYLDRQKVDETTNTNYTFTNLTVGTYEAGVKAVYTSSTAEMQTVEFTVEPVGVGAAISDQTLNIYPNPFKDMLNIDGEYTSLEIFNSTGKLILTVDGDKLINVSALPLGVYIIKANINEKRETYKVIK